MRIEQLTFTRYIAALTVVFFHYGSQVFPANVALLSPILTAGPIAVSYFYTLSGFIMAVAYYRPNQPEAFNKYRYWWARIARIYPVYLLALLLMIAAKWHSNGSDWFAILLSLSMLQAWIPGYPLTLNAPGWSLSVEAFFYLCFPLLIVLAQRYALRTLTWIALVFWLFSQIVHTALLNSATYAPMNWLHDAIYYNPLLHLNTFILGFVGGAWLQQGHLQTLAQPTLNRWGLMGVSVLILALLIARPAWIANSGMQVDFTNGWLAPLFLLLIVLLTLQRGKLSQLLQHRWLVLLGEASFSLYILQKPLHGIYEKLAPTWLTPDSALHFYLFIIVLTLCSLLSYWWFETPVRRFINNFINRNA